MKTLITICLVCVCLLSSNLFAVEYQIINLGTLSGSTYSTAYSINNSGQVVGISGEACLFDSTGGGNNTDLGSLNEEGHWSTAESINNNGQIVGGDHTLGRACLFLTPSTNKNLGSLYGIDGFSWANSINNNGLPVGSSSDGSGNTRACFFNSAFGGAVMNLGTFTDGYNSEAASINDSGQIVGQAMNSSYNTRACIFIYYDNLTDLGTLGGNDSSASSNNNSGQIVGQAQNSSGDYHACLFDSTNPLNNLDLGTLGGTLSGALSINESGQIVGFAADSSGFSHACLFDSGGNINLESYLSAGSGWTSLDYATSINDNGWIAGTGYLNGQQRGFLLKPIPEPATICLLFLGAVSLIRTKK
ncbi:MAG: hypothetical protein ABSE89_06945 [Sedimentisphaerales bacterium]